MSKVTIKAKKRFYDKENKTRRNPGDTLTVSKEYAKELKGKTDYKVNKVSYKTKEEKVVRSKKKTDVSE